MFYIYRAMSTKTRIIHIKRIEHEATARGENEATARGEKEATIGGKNTATARGENEATIGGKNTATADGKKEVTTEIIERRNIASWRHDAINKFISIFPQQMASDIESALYKHLQDKYRYQDNMTNDSTVFQKIYNARVRDWLLLLDPESYAYQEWLADKIKHGVVSPESLVIMKPWESSPESWKETVDSHYQDISNLGQLTQATSNLFKCSKCKKSETIYHEIQTRSSDEPMTTYITCVNCGNHWKQ